MASTGGPNAGAPSSVCLLTQRSRFFIVVKSCLRSLVQVIQVDSVSGKLTFDFVNGKDVFPSEAAALDRLKADGPIEIVAKGQNVLGYVVIGSTALILLADKLRVSCVLPGYHEVKTVVASKWLKIPLQQPPEMEALNPLAREEAARGIDKLTTFPIDGAHYFCETLDITRPFPSDQPTSSPCWEFVWNRWLSRAWRELGLDFICPALLQGLLESRELEDFDRMKYNVALVSRRGRLHVGPRYKARGLNDYAEPGNEIECDQIIWRLPSLGTNGPISWSRYTWRRGSVPLWWGVSIKNNGIGEAEIKIKQNQTFQGSRRYVRRLQKRYCPKPHLDPADDGPSIGDLIDTSDFPPAELQEETQGGAAGGAADASLSVPVVFVSLLRKGTPEKDRSETKLATAFDFVVGALRKQHRLPLTYIALDWHEMDKVLGHDGITEAFWSSIRDMLPAHGFALGTMQKVGPDHLDIGNSSGGLPSQAATASPAPRSERCISSAGEGWQARWFRQQRGLIRYNCADSLDRTNVSSFFGAIQVFVEQCRELDIGVAQTRSSTHSLPSMVRSAPAGSSQIIIGNGLVASANWASARPSSTLCNDLGGAGGMTNGFLPEGADPSQASMSGAAGTSGGAKAKGGGFSAFGNFGKELNNSLNIIMQDFKGPKSSSANLVESQYRSRSTNALSSSQAQQQQQQQQPQPQQQQHQQQQQQSSGASSSQTPGQDPTSLPQGWEAKVDKATQRIFYVDHNTKTTSWERPTLPEPPPSPAPPQQAGSQLVQASGQSVLGGFRHFGSLTAGATPGQSDRNRLGPDSAGDEGISQRSRSEAEREMWEPLSPWCMMAAGVKKFGRRIHPDALYSMAELNLINGDMSAWLYTGSQAMHSERILIFEPETSKLRKAGVGSYGNMLVGIKRRYNNVLVDTDKQQQIEIFLGMKHMVYFCNAYLPYKEEPSIPLDFPETDDDEDPVGQIDYTASVLAGAATATRQPPDRSFNTNALMEEFHRSQTTPNLSSQKGAPQTSSPASTPTMGGGAHGLPRPESQGTVLHDPLS